MTARLLGMYLKGAITAHHLVWECLLIVDPENPGLALEVLPQDLRIQVLDSAREYRPDMLSNYGDIRSPDQVVAARKWIEELHPDQFRTTP
jgi:hypothetical protein